MVRRPFQFFADLEDRTCLITGQKRIDSGSLRAEATSIADSISNHEWQRIALINARVPRQLSTLQACQDTGTDLLLIRSANEWRPEFADDLNLDAVLDAQGKTISAIVTDHGTIEGHDYLFTPSFPIIADILKDAANDRWISSLRRVQYLGNMCLVLRLKQSLSETYWLNVNDAGFPFVGVIEHTNFDMPENYKGSHIAYLSRYLAVSDPVWLFSDKEYFDFAMSHLRRMFPKLEDSWVIEYKVWRSEFAQPVTEIGYSDYVPGRTTPFDNAFISNMAQIYPEDRGTNYSIREGRAIADFIEAKRLQS